MSRARAGSDSSSTLSSTSRLNAWTARIASRWSGGSARNASAKFVPRDAARASTIEAQERADRDPDARRARQARPPVDHPPSEPLDRAENRPAAGDGRAQVEGKEGRGRSNDRDAAR